MKFKFPVAGNLVEGLKNSLGLVSKSNGSAPVPGRSKLETAGPLKLSKTAITRRLLRPRTAALRILKTRRSALMLGFGTGANLSPMGRKKDSVVPGGTGKHFGQRPQHSSAGLFSEAGLFSVVAAMVRAHWGNEECRMKNEESGVTLQKLSIIFPGHGNKSKAQNPKSKV